MIFRNTIQRILVGLATCFCLLIIVGQSLSLASIRELKEASGQMVYQARQTLKAW